MNANCPNAYQLIEKTRTLADSWAPAIGQAEQIETKRGKIVTAISGPISGCPGITLRH
jgi:hypothetical protein